MKTVIYTQRVEIVEAYGERRDCADQRIASFIQTCGFLPVPLANERELAEEYIEGIRPAGILLTGGNSLGKYGGNAPERDAMDQALIQLAMEKSIPLYGFCRGMQSILDYFGCGLTNVAGHVAVRHPVCGEGETYEVNSYHNQACISLKEGCGLNVLAQADDGVIEAVCHGELPIAASMWHPEREKQFQERDINRIRTLFNGSGKNYGQK